MCSGIGLFKDKHAKYTTPVVVIAIVTITVTVTVMVIIYQH